MKLLNAKSRRVQHFIFPPPIPYAILSHTFSSPGHDEWVCYDSAQSQQIARHAIIDKTCRLALENGIEFVWIDAVCVDKRSSFEVSEAINSLWKYLKLASVCIAYLADLPCEASVPWEEAFRKSLFWTRSWTLQEVLLPSRIHFYDSKWHLRGERSTPALSSLISSITGIDEYILSHNATLQGTSIARRMSWAIGRQASRPEDSSYALLGLFAVCIPVVYGEGEILAFRRLQEEIMKTTNDLTLFAWTSVEKDTCRGVFANCVHEFESFGRSKLALPSYQPDGFAALTNHGVLIKGRCSRRGQHLFFDLGIHSDEGERHGILLQQRPDGTFFRTRSWEVQTRTEQEAIALMLIMVDRGDINWARIRIPGLSRSPLRCDRTLPRVLPRRPGPALVEPSVDPGRHESLGRETTPIGSPSESDFSQVSDETGEWLYVMPDAHEPAQNHSWPSSPTSSVRPCHDTRSPFSYSQTTELPASESAAPFPGHSGSKAGTDQADMERVSLPNNARPSASPFSGQHPFIRCAVRRLWQEFNAAQIVSNNTRLVRKQQRRIKNLSARQRWRKGGIRTKRGMATVEPPELACPFFKKDWASHLDCLKHHELKTMSDVIKHLWEHHHLPIHCPVCKEVFGTAAQRDRHLVVRRGCEFRSDFPFRGVSDDQVMSISRAMGTTAGREKQWFRVWEILFPGAMRPQSPYLSDILGLEVSDFRSFYNKRGRALVEDYVRDLGGLSGATESTYVTVADERQVGDLKSKVLSACVTALVDGLLATAET